MDETAVPATDEHFSPATHRGMHGVMSQPETVDAVERVRRDTANQVAGVDILEIQFNSLSLKVGIDPVFQKQTDVTKSCIARGVSRLRAFGQQ